MRCVRRFLASLLLVLLLSHPAAGDEVAENHGGPPFAAEGTRGVESNMSDWITLPPMYTPSSYSVAAGWSDTFCVFGGLIDSSLAGSHVECFNTTERLWSIRNPMPEERGAAAMAPLEGKFLITGGELDYTGGSLLHTFVYDPASENWDMYQELPMNSAGLAAATVDGEVYAMGGFEFMTFPPLQDMYRFNLSNGFWSSAPSMPTARYGLGAAAVGGKVYAMGGILSPSSVIPHEFTAIVEEFDPQSGTWRARTPLPVKMAFFATVVVEDMILVMGGVGENNRPLSSIYMYDAATDNWTSAGRMPTPRIGSVAVYLNGTLYVVGGEGNFYDGSDLYYPGSQEWQIGTAMSIPRSDFGTAVARGGVFAFGGRSGGYGGMPYQPLDTVEEFNPVSGAWSPRSQMPTARYDFATAECGGDIYAIGGNDGAGSTSVVEVYNSTVDSWTVAEAFPHAAQGIAAATLGSTLYVVDGARTYSFEQGMGGWTELAPRSQSRNDSFLAAHDDLLYAIGGWDTEGLSITYVAEVEAYSPFNDSWWKVTDLPTPRANLSVADLDGRLYVMGGSNTPFGPATDIVEVFDIMSQQWQIGTPIPYPRDGFGIAVLEQSILVFGGERGGYGYFEQTDATRRFTPLPADFTLEATFNRSQLLPGETATLTVYFNNTNASARSVELSRASSFPLEVVSENPSLAGGTSTGDGIWFFPSVPAGLHNLSMVLRIPSDIKETRILRLDFVLRFSDYLGGAPKTVTVSATAIIEVPGAGETSYLLFFLGIAFAFGIGSGVGYFGSERSRLVMLAPFIPLWTRLRHEEILDNEKRGMIRGYLAANPGANYSSIREDLGFATGTLVHHLNIMEREGLIKSWNDARFKRYALADHMVAKMEPKLTEIEILLLDIIWKNPNVTQGEVARRLGVSQPAVSYHLTKLSSIGIIAAERRGFRKHYFVTDSGRPMMQMSPETQGR